MEDYSRLIKYMILFSKSKLEKYVGTDLIEQLTTEWDASVQNVLTKADLANMALQLSGSAILKDSSFRKDLLSHMPASEVDFIYNALPAGRRNADSSLEEKINSISSLSWTPSQANLLLVERVGVSQSVFQSRNTDDSVITNHQSVSRFYELLDYQYIVKQRVLNELNKENELTRMLVHMPTGTGKTKTMMHTLVHYYVFDLKKKGLIIWLAHTTELLQQAYDTFCGVWTHLGDGIVKSYKIWGNRNTAGNEFEGIMFCGIQKLQAIRTSNPQMFEAIVNATRLVVFDEAHKAAAKETRLLVEDLMIKKAGMCDRSLIGLTATPGRTTLSSDENKLLTNMFERRIISIDTDTVSKMNLSGLEYANAKQYTNIISFFQEKRILSKLVKEELSYSSTFSDDDLKKIRTALNKNGYTDFSKESLELIGRNRERNSAILKRLKELAVDGIPTIVFACSVTHAKLISYMLSLDHIPNAVVIGSMNDQDRSDAITAFKNRDNSINILINFEVLTTGFDSTNIQCVFITRPTQSIVLYSQMLGRGLRGPKMGGNEKCLLIDIKDNLGKYDSEMAFGHFDAYWNVQ